MMGSSSKKANISYTNEVEISNPFEKLHDDLVITILSKLSSSSSSPSDFINALIVSKRFNKLGINKAVLSQANYRVFGIKAKNWCQSAHRFLKLCVKAGSVEASYFLGMVEFYCLENRKIRASLMARAAIKGHAAALYSISVIQFNGSGGSGISRDRRAGFVVCTRAAFLGHIDAHREMGHCLVDGVGVKQDVAQGRGLLIQANANELFRTVKLARENKIVDFVGSGSSLGEFGHNVAIMDPHPINRFLIKWFKLHPPCPGIHVCSHAKCGRPEMRCHEFRRCGLCLNESYCTRVCQALDWKLRHKVMCPGQRAAHLVNVDPQNGLMAIAPQNDHHQVSELNWRNAKIT